MLPTAGERTSEIEPPGEPEAFDAGALLNQLSWALQHRRLVELGLTDGGEEPDEVYRRFVASVRVSQGSVRDKDELSDALDRIWSGGPPTSWDYYMSPEDELREIAEQLARSESDPEEPDVFEEVCARLVRDQLGAIKQLKDGLEKLLPEQQARAFRLGLLVDRGVRPEQMGKAIGVSITPLFLGPETEENRQRRSEYRNLDSIDEKILFLLSRNWPAIAGLVGPGPDWEPKVRRYWKELRFDEPPPGLEAFRSEFYTGRDVDPERRLARHLDLVEGIRGRLDVRMQKTSSAPPVEVEVNLCRKQGEIWKVRFSGEEATLLDSVGLSYNAHLLEHPGKPITASGLRNALSHRRRGPADKTYSTMDSDTLGDEGLVLGGQEDLGQILDPEARVAYKKLTVTDFGGQPTGIRRVRRR